MKNSFWLFVSVLLLTLLQVGSEGLGAGKYREASDQLQLFLDDWLIDSLEDVRSVLHSPEPKEIVIRMDRPYEDSTMYDPTVILDGHRYRMWYRTNFNQRPFYTGYAESLDGIHWSKPNLGLVEIEGSCDNNVVVADTPNWDIFLDTRPGVAADERIKMTRYSVEGQRMTPTFAGKGRKAVHLLASGDGLTFHEMGAEPILTSDLPNAFDSHTIFFWSEIEQQYLCYFRIRDVPK